jgi:hypothetical protein
MVLCVYASIGWTYMDAIWRVALQIQMRRQISVPAGTEVHNSPGTLRAK